MTILSKSELLELEHIMNRLDELASSMEGQLPERSDRWLESDRGLIWEEFASEVRAAHDALETAEWPDH